VRRLKLFLTLVTALTLVACTHEAAAPEATPATTKAPGLMSVLNMNDPDSAKQLTSGFYGVENNAWRWTASKFSVTLAPPAGAAKNGARLEMKITFPQGSIDKLGPITLSATVGGIALEPEKYTKLGPYDYSRDVPASVLSGDKVTIDFATDKAMPPAVDRRELALIVGKVGLVAK
jgi:hypothetical protein